jgi:hypothetical protein
MRTPNKAGSWQDPRMAETESGSDPAPEPRVSADAICLRCDWTGETDSETCPRCQARVYRLWESTKPSGVTPSHPQPPSADDGESSSTVDGPQEDDNVPRSVSVAVRGGKWLIVGGLAVAALWIVASGGPFDRDQAPIVPIQTASQTDPSAAPQTFACEPRDLTFDSKSMNLTGAWIADDGGLYYLRQIRNDLWWQGMNGAKTGNEATLGKEWNNVLHGTIGHDLRIQADWADVPRGEILGHGTLTLQVVEEKDGMATIRKLDETGTGFGGDVWKPCTPN